MFLIKANADGWVTIKGVHVYIGPSGRIDKGPAKFIGSRPEDLGVKTPSKNSTKGASSKSTGGSKSTTKKSTKKTGGSSTKKTSSSEGSTSKNVKIPNPDSSAKKEVDNQIEGHRFRRETIARYAGIDFNKKEGTYIDRKTGKEIPPKDASTIIDGVAEKLNLTKKGDDNYRKVSGEPLHTSKTSKKSSTGKKELSPTEKYRKENNIPKNVEIHMPQANQQGRSESKKSDEFKVDKDSKKMFRDHYKEGDKIHQIDMEVAAGVEMDIFEGAFDVDTGRKLSTKEANDRMDSVAKQLGVHLDKDGNWVKGSSPKSNSKSVSGSSKNNSSSKSGSYPSDLKSDYQRELYDKNLKAGMSKELAKEIAILDSKDEFTGSIEGLGSRKNSQNQNKSSDRVSSTGEKYPSSVKTTEEKRAYTRARNDGLGKKEAETFAKGTEKIAIGGFTPAMNKKLNEYIDKGYSTEEAVDKVAGQWGYGLGTHKGMFR